METNRVVMATSASTSSVSCTATTVQSSNNPLIHLRLQDLVFTVVQCSYAACLVSGCSR